MSNNTNSTNNTNNVNVENHQIVRKDAKNCFVEVLDSAFNIGKVIFNFVTYDLTKPSGSRFTNNITIYCNFEKFLRFSHDILISKKLLMQLQKETIAANERAKTSGKKEYPYPITLLQGGTSEKSLARRGKSRPDGKAISKILKISPGMKFPILFTAEQGPGESDAKGLIVPKYGHNPEQIVRLGLSAEDCKELFLIVEKHIQAYITSQYLVKALNPVSANTSTTSSVSNTSNTPNHTSLRNVPGASNSSSKYADNNFPDDGYLESLMDLNG